jgi:hypothetical protein
MSDVTYHDLREVQRDVQDLGRDLRAMIRADFDDYWEWKAYMAQWVRDLETRLATVEAAVEALKAITDPLIAPEPDE